MNSAYITYGLRVGHTMRVNIDVQQIRQSRSVSFIKFLFRSIFRIEILSRLWKNVRAYMPHSTPLYNRLNCTLTFVFFF